MDIKFRYLPNSPPPFEIDRKARAARWAAAKADYLAGGSAAEVCELHGLKLSTFRYHAKQGGWRRADQPAPFIAPDPEPEPAPAEQDQPLVIPDAPPGASRDAPPLTAARMADKAWSMLQAAVAAGRLIQARGWMRLYKDLQPFVREEADAARRARLNREAAEQHARPAGETRETQLDCFSGDNAERPVSSSAVEARKPLSIKALTAAITHAADHARALERETMRLSLDCFSGDAPDQTGQGP